MNDADLQRVRDYYDNNSVVDEIANAELVYVDPRDPEQLIDDLIDEWHDGGGFDIDLPDFLGMTKGQYARWVMQRLPAEELAAWAKTRTENEAS